jgi:putative ABC transport system permease protein
MSGWLQAARLARRELRGGIAGFRIFLACLVLGVAAIAAVQSLAAGILDGLREDGRQILGGDVALRLIFHQATDEQRAYLDRTAEAVSASVEMRSMARTPDTGDTALIELKAVDDPYPLYGSVALDGGGALAPALERRDGSWGAVVDPTLMDRLGLALGDRIALGEGRFEIRGIIESEPDRVSGNNFIFGPRVMVHREALAGTGLLRPGSMIYTHYKLRLAETRDLQAYVERLNREFPEAGWRVRTFANAAPQLARMLERVTLFLTLVGLTALLVGGVGVTNAVKAYLDGKIASIATLKCLGAGGPTIFRTYLLQILALGGLGTAIGLAIGAAVPVLAGGLVSDLLPVEVGVGVYPGILGAAALFGLLTAFTFSLWPLARAQAVPAGTLFRDLVAPEHGVPRGAAILATAAGGLGLAGLAVATSSDPWLALYFVIGAAGAVAAFQAAATLIVRGARAIGRPRRPALRLALTNLYRPGTPTAAVMLSLGLGLTVLVAIALIEGNMQRQVTENIPEDAPAFFFVDIQPDQIEDFRALMAGLPAAAGLETTPSMRGRIVAADGVPAQQALVDPEEAWLLRGDRGVTFTDGPKPDEEVIAGDWWPQGYDGPPQVSVYEDIADAFALGIGDTLTVNILGRDIRAEIANIRDIDWRSLSINFTMVFSPEPVSAAPHTYIATIRAPREAEADILRAVADAFPNVTAVRVRDALDTVNAVFVQIGQAVRAIAAVSLVAGTLVLAGAIAAGHRRRIYESVVLKVLGATRGDVLKAYALEYGLLGLLAAAIAAAVGTAAAWAVLTYVMGVDWTFLPSAVISTAALSTAITVAAGFVGTWLALGRKAAPLLRNE